jgi:hypothetical protein
MRLIASIADVLHFVFKYASAYELAEYEQVNTKWREIIISKERGDPLWKYLVEFTQVQVNPRRPWERPVMVPLWPVDGAFFEISPSNLKKETTVLRYCSNWKREYIFAKSLRVFPKPFTDQELSINLGKKKGKFFRFAREDIETGGNSLQVEFLALSGAAFQGSFFPQKIVEFFQEGLGKLCVHYICRHYDEDWLCGFQKANIPFLSISIIISLFNTKLLKDRIYNELATPIVLDCLYSLIAGSLTPLESVVAIKALCRIVQYTEEKISLLVMRRGFIPLLVHWFFNGSKILAPYVGNPSRWPDYVHGCHGDDIFDTLFRFSDCKSDILSIFQFFFAHLRALESNGSNALEGYETCTLNFGLRCLLDSNPTTRDHGYFMLTFLSMHPVRADFLIEKGAHRWLKYLFLTSTYDYMKVAEIFVSLFQNCSVSNRLVIVKDGILKTVEWLWKCSYEGQKIAYEKEQSMLTVCCDFDSYRFRIAGATDYIIETAVAQNCFENLVNWKWFSTDDTKEKDASAFVAIFHQKGNQAFKEGKWQASSAHYSQALFACGFDDIHRRVVLLSNLSQSYFNSGDFTEAFFAASSALFLDATHAKSSFRRRKAILAMFAELRPLPLLKQFSSVFESKKRDTDYMALTYLDGAVDQCNFFELDPRHSLIEALRLDSNQSAQYESENSQTFCSEAIRLVLDFDRSAFLMMSGLEMIDRLSGVDSLVKGLKIPKDPFGRFQVLFRESLQFARCAPTDTTVWRNWSAIDYRRQVFDDDEEEIGDLMKAHFQKYRTLGFLKGGIVPHHNMATTIFARSVPTVEEVNDRFNSNFEAQRQNE